MDDQLAIYDAAMAPIKAREAQEREAVATAQRQVRDAQALIELGRNAPRAAMDAAYRMLPRHLADEVARQIAPPTMDARGGSSTHRPGSLAPVLDPWGRRYAP